MTRTAARLWCGGAAALKRLLNLLAALMLLLMMLLTTVDVLGRYLFNRPVVGASELIEIMLAAAIFLVLPTITWHREHVAVDLAEPYLPRLVRRLRDRLCHLFMTAGVAWMAMTVWKLAERAARYNSVTEYLAIPSAWAMYLIAASLWLTALTFLVLTLLGEPAEQTLAQHEPAQEAPAL
ncbi:TRAP transporter small permease [Zobellella endophytica]|nr:TRAP transporter small permease [Zobellella endophytica]